MQDYWSGDLPGYETHQEVHSALVSLGVLGENPPTYHVFMNWATHYRRSTRGE